MRPIVSFERCTEGDRHMARNCSASGWPAAAKVSWRGKGGGALFDGQGLAHFHHHGHRALCDEDGDELVPFYMARLAMGKI